MRPYSEAVKVDVRMRMGPRHRQSVTEIPQELGIHVITFSKWRKVRRLQGEVVPATPGLIQSVSQAPWPGLSASGEVGEIASSLCPKPFLPQPIST